MNKLISAGFDRLKKDKIFWACMAALLLYSAITVLNGCRQALSPSMAEYDYQLDHYYYSYCLPIGLFCSVFISLYLNTEYRDGTMRNKIIVGHARWEIYLSNLVVSLSAVFLMLLTCLLGGLAGIPFLGPWHSMSMLAVNLLVSFLYVAAYGALFTFVSMLSTNKVLSQILAILLFLGMLVMSAKFYEALMQPEMTQNIVITTEEGMRLGEPLPNPKYISGPVRDAYEFLVDLLPTGQCLQMYDLKVVRPLRMALLSLCIVFGITAAGLALFRRKDLN